MNDKERDMEWVLAASRERVQHIFTPAGLSVLLHSGGNLHALYLLVQNQE